MRQGISDRREYAWRDHRMLVGRSYDYDLRYCLTVPILMIQNSEDQKKTPQVFQLTAQVA